MGSSTEAGPSGLLIVDKPEGPTSHDVVARVRRALHTRRVGHAGTLDPMATGVLVMLVGEATKLEPHLATSQKSYVAEIALGRSTDTLDRLGATLVERAIPEPLSEELGRLERSVSTERSEARGCEYLRAQGAGLLADALGIELARTSQIPPQFSAIKVDGQKSYDRARRGETFELAARDVRLLRARCLDASRERGSIRIEMLVTKGYYVRSFARDLGEALSVPAHLMALRRIESGAFTLDAAVSPEASSEVMLAHLIPLQEAARRSMPWAELTTQGVFRAERGQPLTLEDFEGQARPGAWFDGAGRLVAIGTLDPDGIGRVQRGFVAAQEPR